MYVLVEFTDDSEIAVKPDLWLDGTQCALWPNHVKNTNKINLMVKQQVSPGESWPAFPIRELYRNASYEKTRGKLQKAEKQSDLGTTTVSGSDSEGREDLSRKSKRRKRAIVFSSDEELDEIERPTRPNKPKSTTATATFSSSIPTPPSRLPALSGTFGQFSEPPLPSQRTSLGQSAFDVSEPGTSSQPSRQFHVETTPNRSIVARDVKLFTILEKQGQQLAEIKETLLQVFNIVKSGAVGLTIDQTIAPEGVSLPVISVEDVRNLEEQLVEETTFKALVNHLSVVGGRNFTDMCRRVMKHCMTNFLAMQYNWYGQKNKECFGKLRLADAVQKAVVKSQRCTASQVELVCREWFRTAGDREGGRKKRGSKNRHSLEEEGLDCLN